MKQLTLGRTGLKVSQFGFGGLPLLSVPLEEAVNLLNHALDRGLNFWDTAAMYDDSEAKMGRVLAGNRERVIIATKTEKRDVDGATEHLEASFANLETDYIDLYQLHNVSKDEDLAAVMAPGGVVDFLEDIRDQGRIGHLGVSSHHPETARRAVETGRFETLQFPYNFIERQAEDGLFDLARSKGLGLIAMKPLGGGLLDRAGLCFGFLRGQPDVIPIPGFKTPVEVDQIIDIYRRPVGLTPDQAADIETLRREIGTRFCRRCGYCLPCPEEIEIPLALMIPASIARNTPDRVREVFGLYAEQAAGCLDCGECTEKCPYNLPVSEMLVDVREQYDRAVSGN